MQAKLTPCKHLKQLIQGAGATGQGDNGIGIHKHHLFALMHGFGYDIAG